MFEQFISLRWYEMVTSLIYSLVPSILETNGYQQFRKLICIFNTHYEYVYLNRHHVKALHTFFTMQV